MFIEARNVHAMLPVALEAIDRVGISQPSRNGPVIRFPTPVILQYHQPRERVLFHPERDANPFFHLMEALWMMAGRNDVHFVSQFVKRMKEFSDDGMTFNGAYGYRWRRFFGVDQIRTIALALKKNPDDRRQVLQMWDAKNDLGLQSKDLPCNTQATFQVVAGRLDMCVFNRSNDLVWGATGANAVHFSVLQEWMAAAVGVPVGSYYQISANLHLYLDRHANLMDGHRQLPLSSPYDLGVELFPLVNTDPHAWLDEVSMFVECGTRSVGLRDRFLRRVAMPMLEAWECYKDDDVAGALQVAYNIEDQAWARACQEWLMRRRDFASRRMKANDDGVNYEA